MILDGALLPPGCPCVDGGATAQVAVDGMASSGKCFVNLYIACPRWRLTASLTLLTSLNSMTWTGHQRGRFSHQKFTRAMALNCSMIYRSYYYHLLHLFFLLILSLSLYFVNGNVKQTVIGQESNTSESGDSCFLVGRLQLSSLFAAAIFVFLLQQIK